jgi:acyl transferase domain-containing protein
MTSEVDIADADDFAVAVVGLAGRFPGAADVEAFWGNLCRGVEAIRDLDPEELAASGVDPAISRSSGYLRRGAIVDGEALFDADYFGYSPREAAVMDPQQRFLLETSVEALHDAGYDAPAFPGPIGIFASAGFPQYMVRLFSDPDVIDTVGEFLVAITNEKDYLATRVAYQLDLRGPAMTVQTACSSSLVAVHLAGQSLLSGECDMALAGGVSIRVPQRVGYRVDEADGIASADGHCRAFDADATGTVTGNGVGVVVLRRLADALRDGDNIRAVIRGSAVTNDGAGKVGFTAPGVDGQARAIRTALAVAGVGPETVGYVETHGTATPLGDPIEVAALTEVFRPAAAGQWCALGSVKTNVGHLDAAAGVTALIKTVLAVQHSLIPPSLHFHRPNPNIDFAASPFFVNAKLDVWADTAGPRRAGVSSFGIGGTNVHVVLEQAPEVPARPAACGPSVLVLSARSRTALDAMTRALADRLDDEPALALPDVAWTLQTGRAHLPVRRAAVATSTREAAAALRSPGDHLTGEAHAGSSGARIVALFPGQGAQYTGMGRELYAAEPVFRQHVDRCADLLRPCLGRDVRVLLGMGGEPAAGDIDLTFTALAQPALFVVEYALAKLFESWGVRPAVLVGHSVGEYVAACLDGVFDLPDALAVVAARGRLVGELPPGSMLAVGLPAEELVARCGAGVELAAVNAPAMCVASGTVDAVEALRRELAAEEVQTRRLRTSHAFHSAAMEPALEAFREVLEGVRLHAPTERLMSNVTGGPAAEAGVDRAGYWVGQLRQPVLFADCVAQALAGDPVAFLEIGPRRTLGPLVRAQSAGVPAVESLNSGTDDVISVRRALARLWATGVPIDWPAMHDGARRRVALPPYQFDRTRHWIDPSAARRVLPRPAATGPTEYERGTAAAAAGPMSGTEREIATIWSEVLGVADAGVHDDFFELGGHSLVAGRVAARLRTSSGVDVSIRTILTHPTLGGLATAVDALRVSEPSPAPGVDAGSGERTSGPLSSAQERVWFLVQLRPETPMWMMVNTCRMRGPLDADALHRALSEVVRRQWLLRTAILYRGGRAVQEVQPARPQHLPVLDLTHLAAAEREAEVAGVASRTAGTTIDIGAGAPLVTTLLRLGPADHCLVFGFHHIVSDHWSTGVFLDELFTLYDAFHAGRPGSLPELTTQYVDVARRQQESLAAGHAEDSLAYWREQLTGAVPLELGWTRPRPAVPSFRGAALPFAFDEATSADVERLASAGRATPFMVLMTALQALLAHEAGTRDVCVGTLTANRDTPDLEHIVGLFVNPLVIRTDVDGDLTFCELLQRVRETCLDAYAHAHVPFERILRDQRVARDLSRNPLYQVALVMENSPVDRARASGLEIELDAINNETSKLDLTLAVYQEGGGPLFGFVEYSTDLFEPPAVERFLARYRRLVAAAAARPHLPTHELITRITGGVSDDD